MRRGMSIVAVVMLFTGGLISTQPTLAAGLGARPVFATGPSTQPAVLVGVPNPESSYFDPSTGDWFISSLGLVPDAEGRNGDGSIARIDSTGQILADPWVTGLNSPKGMRSRGDSLYVADIDTLVEIDIPSATITQRIELPGADILNDVDVHANGDIYATDWTGNKLYRVSAGTPEVFLDTPDLESPNGIIVEGDTLTIAAWGTNTNKDLLFATDEPGRILQVDIPSRTITPLGDGERIGGLDGIERDGDSYLVTDWTGGRLLRVDLDGSAETLRQLLPSTADIGFDPTTRTIGIPIIVAQLVLFEQI